MLVSSFRFTCPIPAPAVKVMLLKFERGYNTGYTAQHVRFSKWITIRRSKLILDSTPFNPPPYGGKPAPCIHCIVNVVGKFLPVEDTWTLLGPWSCHPKHTSRGHLGRFPAESWSISTPSETTKS